MNNRYLLILIVLFILVAGAGCISEHERNGVSNAPFNTPEDNSRRTFDGDW